MSKALLIDFDGTLANSITKLKNVLTTFLAKQNINLTDELFQRLNGPPLQDIITILKETFSLPQSNQELLQQYRGLILDAYQTIQPNEGANTLLQQASQDHNIVIVTSNHSDLINHWLDQHKLKQYIHDIVDGKMVEKGKPNPEPYLLGLEKSDAKANNAMAIEDSAQGITAALQAGVTTFGLINDYSRQEKDKPAFANVRWIHSLNDVIEHLYDFSHSSY